MELKSGEGAFVEARNEWMPNEKVPEIQDKEKGMLETPVCGIAARARGAAGQ